MTSAQGQATRIVGFGTVLMADSDKLIIVGRIIIPSNTEAVKTVMPLPEKVLTQGTNNCSPKKSVHNGRDGCH